MRHSFDTYVSFFNSREGVACNWFLPAGKGRYDARIFVRNQAANLNLIGIVCNQEPSKSIQTYLSCCGELKFNLLANNDAPNCHYGVLKDEIVEVLGKMAVQIGRDPDASSCSLESVVTQWRQEQQRTQPHRLFHHGPNTTPVTGLQPQEHKTLDT